VEKRHNGHRAHEQAYTKQRGILGSVRDHARLNTRGSTRHHRPNKATFAAHRPVRYLEGEEGALNVALVARRAACEDGAEVGGGEPNERREVAEVVKHGQEQRQPPARALEPQVPAVARK